MGVRTGSDGIQAGHDLLQHADESFRGFKGSGIFHGQVQHVATPQEIAEGFLVPGQKRFQFLAAGGRRPFGQQGLVDVRDVVMVDQSLAQIGAFAVRSRDGGAWAEAELFNQRVRQGGIVGGNNGQSVSSDVFQAGAVQAVFNVDGLFGAVFRGEVLDGKYGCGKRILLAVWFGSHV